MNIQQVVFSIMGIVLLGAPMSLVSAKESHEDIFGDWESPYSVPDDMMQVFEEAEESGTCWQLMNTKLLILTGETRYWQARAVPDSEGADALETVFAGLESLQIGMGDLRVRLEALSGQPEDCEENTDVAGVQEPIEDMKYDMRLAGFYIDTRDAYELTEEIVDQQCEDANAERETLAEHISALSAKLTSALEVGDLDAAANVKEMMAQAELNFGHVSVFLTQQADLTDLTERMEACSGALQEAQAGTSLFQEAHKYYKGTEEDTSADADQIDAKIKLFVDLIAAKRVDATQRENKSEILETLQVAQDELVAIQEAFALIKYVEDADFSDIDTQLESLKMFIEDVAAVVEEGEEKTVSDGKLQNAVSSVLDTARLKEKTLEHLLESKEDDADSDEEQAVYTFVEQGAGVDVEVERLAAKGFKKVEDYEQAQWQALQSIEAAKAATRLLKGIE